MGKLEDAGFSSADHAQCTVSYRLDATQILVLLTHLLSDLLEAEESTPSTIYFWTSLFSLMWFGGFAAAVVVLQTRADNFCHPFVWCPSIC